MVGNGIFNSRFAADHHAEFGGNVGTEFTDIEGLDEDDEEVGGSTPPQQPTPQAAIGTAGTQASPETGIRESLEKEFEGVLANIPTLQAAGDINGMKACKTRLTYFSSQTLLTEAKRQEARDAAAKVAGTIERLEINLLLGFDFGVVDVSTFDSKQCTEVSLALTPMPNVSGALETLLQRFKGEVFQRSQKLRGTTQPGHSVTGPVAVATSAETPKSRLPAPPPAVPGGAAPVAVPKPQAAPAASGPGPAAQPPSASPAPAASTPQAPAVTPGVTAPPAATPPPAVATPSAQVPPVEPPTENAESGSTPEATPTRQTWRDRLLWRVFLSVINGLLFLGRHIRAVIYVTVGIIALVAILFVGLPAAGSIYGWVKSRWESSESPDTSATASPAPVPEAPASAHEELPTGEDLPITPVPEHTAPEPPQTPTMATTEPPTPAPAEPEVTAPAASGPGPAEPEAAPVANGEPTCVPYTQVRRCQPDDESSETTAPALDSSDMAPDQQPYWDCGDTTPPMVGGRYNFCTPGCRYCYFPS